MATMKISPVGRAFQLGRVIHRPGEAVTVDAAVGAALIKAGKATEYQRPAAKAPAGGKGDDGGKDAGNKGSES